MNNMEENIPANLLQRFVEFLKLIPLLFILIILVYALNSSARQAIDDFLLQTPAKSLVASQYSIYPAFLDENDVVVKKATFNDSGKETQGLIIEIHSPAALAQTSTNSMKPMFGPGNLLVQEEVNSSIELYPGDIVVYEDEGGKMIIHQIISESGGCYTTKGLNNPVPDTVCVTKKMIKFRLLFAIPTK